MLMTERLYSLRWRLLSGTASLLLVILGLLSMVVWTYANRAANLSYDRVLTGAGLSIAERVRLLNDQIELDIPYAAFEMLALAPEDKVYYQIVGPEGEHLTGYEQFPDPPGYVSADIPQFYNLSFLSEPIRVVVISKRLLASGVNSWVQVRVGQSRIARDQLMTEMLYGQLTLLILVILLALSSLAFGIKRALDPLNRLSKALIERKETDLEPLPSTSIREIRPLTEAIDQYRNRLELNIDAMRIFIADASHQIRSSLSGVQAQLDMASYVQNDIELKDRLNKIRIQHEKLTRLTNQLLAHALVVHRGDTQPCESLYLDKFLRELLTEIVRDHAHTDIEFAYQCNCKDSYLFADKMSLREAMKNLFDNAIKYGPADNTITLTAEQKGHYLIIAIEDHGMGIPTELHEQVLNRFYRVNKNHGIGSGLGLAIVDSVIKVHGGKLMLHNLKPKGLKVELYFPSEPK